MKLSLFTSSVVGILFALASCQSPVTSLSSAAGRLKVSVVSGQRALVADVASQVTKYQVELSSDGGVSLSASFDPADVAGVSFDAVAGVWDVNVVAFAGSAIVGQGSLENQTVESGVDTALSVALVTSQSGSGSIRHAFTVPTSSVDSVTAHLNTLTGNPAGSFTSPVLTVSGAVATGTLEMESVASGNYRLTIEFRKGSNVVKTTVEAVNVYDHLVTNRWVDSAGLLKSVRVFGVGDFTSFPGTLTGPSTMVAQALASADTATSLVALATDASGNTYAVLNKDSDAFALAVGSQSFPATRTTALVKFDSVGNALWVAPVSGLEVNSDVCLVADDAGNVFLAGGLVPTNALVFSDASNAAVVTEPALASGDYAAFVAKYNSAGTPLWAHRQSDTSGGWSSFNALALSGTGSSQRVIAAGEIDAGTYQFGTLTVQGTSSYNPVVAVFDTDGHGIWATSMDKINGSTSPTDPPYFVLMGVGADGQGNITVSGVTGSEYLGTPADGDTFELVDPQGQHRLTYTNHGASRNQVLVKYSPEGVPLWAQGFGSNATLLIATGNLAVDTLGRSFWTGVGFNGDLDLGTGVTLNFGSNRTNVVAGFDADGTALWLKSAGPAGMMDLRIWGILGLDQQGGVYFAGAVKSSSDQSIDLGDGVVVQPTASTGPYTAPVLVKFASDLGTTLWARTTTQISTDAQWQALSLRGGVLAVGGVTTNTEPVDFGDSKTASGLYSGGLNSVMALYGDVY